MKVTVTVRYLVKGTVHEVKMTGARHSSQIWDSGRAVIIIFDKKDRKKETWQGSQIVSIHTKMERSSKQG